MGYSPSFVTVTVEGGISVPKYLGSASNPFLLTAASKSLQLVEMCLYYDERRDILHNIAMLAIDPEVSFE